MKIGKADLDREVLVIAEIGNNHEGIFDLAEKMVYEAASCGVQAVKFQTFQTELFVSKADLSRYKRLKSFELSYPQFSALAKLAHSLGLIFISTPLDLASAKFLDSIVDCYKIASADNNFFPLLEVVAQTGKPIIISTGLSDISQVIQALDFIREKSPQKMQQEIAILHCITSYPVPPEQVNLRAIPFLQKKLSVTVGYSDHTLGIDAALCAAALGAKIIEKHFTLDKNYSDFRDHKLSADPPEMTMLVEKIKQISPMLGNEEKDIQPCEKEVISMVRRSIVAGTDLPRGHCLTPADLSWIRPAAGGLPPGQEHLLLGRRLKKSVVFGRQLNENDVE